MSTTVGRAASNAAGSVLAAGTRTLAAVRPAPKPLHPRGEVRRARLLRFGLHPPVGVGLLDTAGDVDVVARLSRSVGLPSPLPDVQGLALRVPNGDGTHGDLLFATTGWGPVSRFVFTPSRTPHGRPMTTLLPYRTPAGPLLLGIRSTGAHTRELACASPAGGWRVVGDLQLGDDPAEDRDVDFDPVLHRVPGLEQYDWVTRLREASYAAARATRHH